MDDNVSLVNVVVHWLLLSHSHDFIGDPCFVWLFVGIAYLSVLLF